MSDENKMYMIRRKKDGLFSNGYYQPWFSHYGKVWYSLKGLRNHITQVLRHNGAKKWNRETRRDDFIGGEFFKLTNAYLDCEIVEMTRSFVPVQDMYPFVVETEKKKLPKGRKKKVTNGTTGT